ncbi:MAG TPA: histidine kinase [Pseudonocardiaceae bacterium]|nr:histidine kinase [Pseudonocardiaceae bacterium]
MTDSAHTGPRRRWRLPPPVGDVLAAMLTTATTVYGSIGESYPFNPADRVPNGHVAPWPAFLLVAAASVVLLWRRRYPLRVLAASVAGVGVYSLLGYVNGAALLAPLLALYAVSVALPARRAWQAAAATFVVLAATTVVDNPLGTFGGSIVLLPALVAIALLAGFAVSNRRAYVAALAARAEEAERTREEEARRRVDAERLRIARELHDVVAHTMATINVQAGVAAHVIPGLPAPADEALRAIKDASKRGLRELRAILAVLRQVDEAEPIEPAAGLAALDVLVSTATAAGLPTQVCVSGVERPLPAAVDLAAYRIIQESLTNAIRYAAPATATIRLDFAPDHLDIEVTDTGQGTAGSGDGGGHGLIGMRERAATLGGTMRAEPRAQGGFQVLACLPTGTP